jgi:RNA polymerase sigma-70 factor (ECF subfamily)
MPDEITDDKMTISDSHPLGALLERELEEEYI